MPNRGRQIAAIRDRTKTCSENERLPITIPGAYVQSLADFVRSRPAQSVESFMQQSNAVIAHDAEAQLGRIKSPTLITFGRHDVATSTRFADRMKRGIPNSELLIFEDCAHAPIYENVAEFNDKTLQFLKRHTGAALGVAS